MDVRILTLNLQSLANGWFEARAAAVNAALRRLKPDILCLQEVTVCHQGTGLYDQARAVADACGLGFVAFDTYGPPDDIRAEQQQGLAIAARWPFRRVSDRRLPSAPHDRPDGRVAMLCQVMHPEGDIDVVTTHLAWRSDEDVTHLMQADLLLDVFHRQGFGRGGHRGVLAGDLNATEDEPVIRRLGASLLDAYRAMHPESPGHTWLKSCPYTVGWSMPSRRLDYVFVPKDARIRQAEVVMDGPEAGGVWPSDHAAVLVDLTW